MEDLNTFTKLKKTVSSILSKTTRTSKEINHLKEVIKYNDVLFYTWKILANKFIADKCNDNVYLSNVIELLEAIAPPISFLKRADEMEGEKTYLPRQNEKKKFILDEVMLSKLMGKTWQSLINRNLTPVIHRKLLFLLLESYLSKIDNPIFLTDFLMASLNMKGAISVLALEGIAQLMLKHNIEYPNIYGKLYTMFERDIFQKKFKARLFYLANLFLSSICLPESIVASFVKRAARLTFYASAADIPFILSFICNLLVRHPMLKSMVHHEKDIELSEDPFLMDEKDPMKTCASKSSLWEIKLLKNHCLPNISAAAKFIDSDLPSMERDLGETLGKTYLDFFKSETKRKKTDKPSLTYYRPQHSIANIKDDKLYKLWSLTE